MAEPRTCRNIGKAPINDSGTSKSTATVFCASIFLPAQIPTPAQVSAHISAFTFVPSPPKKYTNED